MDVLYADAINGLEPKMIHVSRGLKNKLILICIIYEIWFNHGAGTHQNIFEIFIKK